MFKVNVNTSYEIEGNKVGLLEYVSYLRDNKDKAISFQLRHKDTIEGELSFNLSSQCYIFDDDFNFIVEYSSFENQFSKQSFECGKKYLVEIIYGNTIVEAFVHFSSLYTTDEQVYPVKLELISESVEGFDEHHIFETIQGMVECSYCYERFDDFSIKFMKLIENSNVKPKKRVLDYLCIGHFEGESIQVRKVTAASKMLAELALESHLRKESGHASKEFYIDNTSLMNDLDTLTVVS
ncbi:MAG: hypothetical protein CMK64_05015 [Pseudoalteromonas sp.]|nr:hypothetical protein [Pseudoalteromonas sp.]|tara:strand:- start:13444 stop:14157 length:714 start_codon:yes stop_codon:yes gene_type:complete